MSKASIALAVALIYIIGGLQIPDKDVRVLIQQINGEGASI